MKLMNQREIWADVCQTNKYTEMQVALILKRSVLQLLSLFLMHLRSVHVRCQLTDRCSNETWELNNSDWTQRWDENKISHFLLQHDHIRSVTTLRVKQNDRRKREWWWEIVTFLSQILRWLLAVLKNELHAVWNVILLVIQETYSLCDYVHDSIAEQHLLCHEWNSILSAQDLSVHLS